VAENVQSKVRVSLAALTLSILVSAAANAAEPQVCFTPGEDCDGMLINQIGRAKSEILVQAMLFTNMKIAKALVVAEERGVKVRAIFSRRTGKAAAYLHERGVDIVQDTDVKTQHNKVMILDRSIVATGSYNYTNAAENKNAENIVFLDTPGVAKRFVDNWIKRANASHPYKPDEASR